MQLNRMLDYLLGTTAPGAVIVIRFLTGSVFLSEGIQKFLYPAELGVGRFEKLGIISATKKEANNRRPEAVHSHSRGS